MSKRNQLLVVTFLTSCACLLAPAARLRAQEGAATTPQPTTRYRFQYAAKFFCTMNVPGTSQATPSVLPGSYQTVVSVHNPHYETIRLRKKIAVTYPAGEQQPGPVSEFLLDRLDDDQALQVDCRQILQRFGITFIHGAEGFLVIESTHSLDVNAAYTAGALGSGVQSIAVEQVRERRLR